MGDDKSFMDRALVDLSTVAKLKEVMLVRGLTAARAKCPRCGNETLQGRIAGYHKHISAWCATPTCTFTGMME